ncbi:calcium-binding protein, partial [Bradyrhizobium diazoefficiens]
DETGGDGTDLVKSSVTFDMSGLKAIDDIENLTLTGAVAINGTGNALDNVIIGNSAANVIAGLGGADTLDGGAGIDTANYAASGSGVNVSLATGTGTGGDAEGDTLVNFENLKGSAFDDTLEGSSGNNTLTGGAGNDTVSYANAGAGVTVSLAIQDGVTAQNTIGAGTDILSGFENVSGSDFNDTLTGDSLANILTGNDGNDTLNGGVGADTMLGGLGNDTYVVDNAGDVVDETGGDGTDLVKSSVTFDLSGSKAIGGIENLTLTGAVAINGSGNALDNVIIGNSAANVIEGLDGADTLDGAGGVDTASYAASASGVNVSLATGIGKGGDAEGDTLVNFENLTGSAFDDTLAGNSGNNTLLGGTGNDTLDGGAGNDTLTGGVGADKYIYA